MVTAAGAVATAGEERAEEVGGCSKIMHVGQGGVRGITLAALLTDIFHKLIWST